MLLMECNSGTLVLVWTCSPRQEGWGNADKKENAKKRVKKKERKKMSGIKLVLLFSNLRPCQFGRRFLGFENEQHLMWRFLKCWTGSNILSTTYPMKCDRNLFVFVLVKLLVRIIFICNLTMNFRIASVVLGRLCYFQSQPSKLEGYGTKIDDYQNKRKAPQRFKYGACHVNGTRGPFQH